MTNNNKITSQLKKINDILWNNWDPLGLKGAFKTQDEYESYAVEIFNLLKNKAPEEEIAQRLCEIEENELLPQGIKGDLAKCERVAAMLLSNAS